MKKTKKFLALALATGLVGGGMLPLAFQKKVIKEVKADSFQTYVPLRDGWIENNGGGDAGSAV